MLTLLVAGLSHALPIMYDEATDGDLSGQTLNMDVGLNTIIGAWTLVFPATQDYDSFSFVVPTGSIVTSVSLSFDGSGVALTMMEKMMYYLQEAAG